MNLTIIVPNCRDREMLHRIAKSGLGKDEIIRLKVTSRTVKVVLDKAIENAIYDDILIVNPKNIKIKTKDNSIDRFRVDEVVLTETKNSKVSRISSIKFNRSDFKSNDSNIRNIYKYIANLVNEIDGSSISPIETFKPPKRYNEHKPKILFITDVIGWA